MLVRFNEFSEEQKEEFTTAFYACSSLTRKETIEQSGDDWGCPWMYHESEELDGTNPKEWARCYYERYKGEIDCAIHAGTLCKIDGKWIFFS